MNKDTASCSTSIYLKQSNIKCQIKNVWLGQGGKIFSSLQIFQHQTEDLFCFFYLVMMNLGDLLKYHILFMEWKVPKAEQSAPTHTTHCITLLLGHWYEIMALYYVKLILTEISASRQDRRVLQKSKIIRIEFLSKWGMLQTSRYV